MDRWAHDLVWLCMWTMLGGVIVLCAWMYPPLHEAKMMDCSLAEFSPDVSTEIKKLCREAKEKK